MAERGSTLVGAAGAGGTGAGAAGLSEASVADYLALLKPRVMSLVVFTGLVGLVLAPVPVHPATALTALLAIAVGAGAAGALNMWYDADIDAVMQRTAMRPVPQGRIAPDEARAFGTVLAVGSVTVMGLLVNWAAAGLLALTIGFYLFVYTMWLKRRTPYNIVIGGAAGALPPLIGWAAATGGVAVEPIALFLIIFFWTPPHFWALGLVRSADYARAGVPMMPVVRGGDETRRQILIYSVILVPLAFAPLALGFAGALYAGLATLLGAGFLHMAWRVFVERQGTGADRAARRLFAFSILYLFGLFAALLAESAAPALARAVGGPW
jgi:protoheme IX farnesyltransferase